VLDNLVQGHRAAVLPGAELIIGGHEPATLDALLGGPPFDGVLHFASLSLVDESMRQPLRYIRENATDALTLLEACVRHGVKRFVFSSSASVYGNPDFSPIPETAPLAPTNAYGESKLIVERAMGWADRAHGMRCATLRYFNAAGADPAGRLGEDHDPETHLIPLVIDAALGRRREISVNGRDYPTPDGTCVRDYVHVTDLADAHLLALDRLQRGSVTCNLGTGRGWSVLEVIRTVEEVSGRRVPLRMGERRPGDPARLVACAELVRRETGWIPRYPELRDMVASAYAWRLAHPAGYAGRTVTGPQPGASKAGMAR
jgi:UDP-glucose 4-epimerase